MHLGKNHVLRNATTWNWSHRRVLIQVVVTGAEATRSRQAMHALYPHSVSIVPFNSIHPLLIVLLIGIIDDVEKSELVDTLGGRDNTEPISQLLLLEEFLCPIPTESAGFLFPLSEKRGNSIVLTGT
jgi:predicted LPLAT superfamily acyltransferase